MAPLEEVQSAVRSPPIKYETRKPIRVTTYKTEKMKLPKEPLKEPRIPFKKKAVSSFVDIPKPLYSSARDTRDRNRGVSIKRGGLAPNPKQKQDQIKDRLSNQQNKVRDSARAEKQNEVSGLKDLRYNLKTERFVKEAKERGVPVPVVFNKDGSPSKRHALNKEYWEGLG